jgi:hypothetical protein
VLEESGTDDIEGEQFANAFFTLETKIKIAKAYVYSTSLSVRETDDTA